MPNYSPLTINTVFETVWDIWKNKEGEAAALKSVTFFLKEHTKEELLKACEMYVLDNALTDPGYTYKLSNFINLDHWIDTLESNNLEKLRARNNAAIEVINEWNKACCPHWIKVLDIESRIPLAMLAIDNKFFASHWKDALEKAKKIFAFRFREGDVREKININFRWFCNVSSDKHTVLRIIEGDYGGPAAKRIVKSYTTKEIDHAARQALAEEMKTMFPNIKFEPPLKQERPVEKLTLTKEANEIVNQIMQQAKRNIPNEVSKGDSVEGEPIDPFIFE